MLEAVNSVLSNASYTKAVADQQSVAGSFAANPDRVQQATLQAPYISLYIKVDVNFDKALLQLRDPDTGDVVQTIPSEVKLEAYRRAQSVAASRQAAQEEAQISEDTVEISTPEPVATPAPQAVEAPVVTSAPTPAPAAPTTTSAQSAPATISVDTSA